MFKILILHRTSISGAAWCKPVGWRPENVVAGGEYVDGSWWDEDGEVAGLAYYTDAEEGSEIEVDPNYIVLLGTPDMNDLGPVELPWVEGVDGLCQRMEDEACEFGGIPHSAERRDWGIESRMTIDGFDLVDCDGVVWASGTSREILAKEESLLAGVRRATRKNEVES